MVRGVNPVGAEIATASFKNYYDPTLKIIAAK